VLSGRTYTALREGSKKILKRVPAMWEFARRSEEHMKGMVLPGTLFEELGFNYHGPSMVTTWTRWWISSPGCAT